MRSRLLLIIFLLAATLNVCAQSFNPADAKVISSPSELMTHGSVVVAKEDGTLFFAYLRDTTQTHEVSSTTSISPVLVKSHFPELNIIDKKELVRAGETIGSFIQSPTRSPYDPNLLLLGDTLFCYFTGCIDGTVTLCARRYNVNTGKLDDKVEVCQLAYDVEVLTNIYDRKVVPFDSKSTFAMLEEMGIRTAFTNDVIMTTPFQKYKGEWYTAFGNAFPKHSKPVIIKTSDGIHFEVVMVCKEFHFGTCEASVAIWHDEFYVLERNSGVERGGRGTFLAKYAPDGRCLVPPVYLTEAQVKPALIVHKGRLYAFYNANPSLYTDWGLVSRSRLRMARIGRQCQLRKTWDITSPYGIHYVYPVEIDGNLYITFSEDRRQLNIEMTRSDIGFVKVLP